MDAKTGPHKGSLHRVSDVHPFAAFPAIVRFNRREAAKRVERATVRTAGAATLGTCELGAEK